MQDITLKQLEIFNAVVVAGSITKASRRIGLSQPSISQQLAKLEERLGSQLVVRKRGGSVGLTPAGEYWFSASTDMITRLRTAFTEHDQRFVSKSLTLRLGITPTFRGRLVSEAAKIASRQAGFIKFEVSYASTSAELVEMLRLHQINCAIVNDDEVVDNRNAFMVTQLFEDPVAWAVPASVPALELEAALKSDHGGTLSSALHHFVDVESQASLRGYSLDWFRHRLPFASPTYSSNSYPLAIDLVAAGLATSHCPASMLPSLSEATRKSIRLLNIGSMKRNVVLAMPKHLMSLRSYAQTYTGIVDFCRNEYAMEMDLTDKELKLVA